MGKMVYSLLVAFLLLFSTAIGLSAQTTQSGLRVKEEKSSTIIYQIRVIGLGGPVSAQQLDESMRRKREVHSSSTDAQSGICTVEVDRSFPVHYFRHVLALHGLTMAKKFE